MSALYVENLNILLSTAIGMRKNHVLQVTNKHIATRITRSLIIGVEGSYEENKVTWSLDLR